MKKSEKQEEFNTILDYFEETMNSNMWPSDDPTDSPFNTFTCKLCGFQFYHQIFGAFPENTDPYDAVKKRIVEHLAVRHHIEIPIRI